MKRVHYALLTACLTWTGVFPTHLSELQLRREKFSAYSVNAPLWADDLDKGRSLCVPIGQKLAWSASPPLIFQFPAGTTVRKDFNLPTIGTPVETRISLYDGKNWRRASYQWNSAHTDALRVDNDARVTLHVPIDGEIRLQVWTIPGPRNCMLCHQAHEANANGALGLRPAQISKDQLSQWIAAGKLTSPPGGLDSIDEMPSYQNTLLSSEVRARSYLQANCAHCHFPGSSVPVDIDLRYSTPTDKMGIVNVSPQYGNLGIPNAKIVNAGNPESSILLERMKRLDENRMPFLGSAVLDDEGIQIVSDWIRAL